MEKKTCSSLLILIDQLLSPKVWGIFSPVMDVRRAAVSNVGLRLRLLWKVDKDARLREMPTSGATMGMVGGMTSDKSNTT